MSRSRLYLAGVLTAVALAGALANAPKLFNPFCYVFPKDSIEWIAAGCLP